jgi:outer membrane protein TolC
VVHEEPASSIEGPLIAVDAADPFGGQAELALEQLVTEVHRRNPTLQASLAAWASAAERYPQVVALDDPMLQSMLAPGTFPNSSNVQSSYYVGIALQLREVALQQRPDLAAQAARIQAEQASLALACKEYYPDFEFMGRYDQFWTDVEQRPQVGMNVNVPLNLSRRNAAVREATFRLSKMQAEYEQQVDNILHDVEAGLARLDGSHQKVALYTDRILPAARANVESANSGYVAGAVDFLRLIEAQRELIELQEKHQEAIAEHHRRRAELERVVGAPILQDGSHETGTAIQLDE